MNILKQVLFSNLLISAQRRKNLKLKRALREKEPEIKTLAKNAIELFRLKNRIKNLSLNPTEQRSLINTINRMNHELELKGVETVDPTGLEYHDFLNFNVINFIKGELRNGKESVIRTIRPEIIYKGKSYSVATVVVGVD